MRMQRLLSILVTLAWALWFGGLLTLFIAVQSLFATFGDQRAIAGSAAAGIFRRFELFQLALAAAALLATLAWRILSGRSKLKVAILMLLCLATVCAIVEAAFVARTMERLRSEGQTQTDEFRTLHGRSMMLYMGETVLLLIAGLLLPSAIYRDGNQRAFTTEDGRGFEADAGARETPAVVVG
jgi:uncharacterized membrane protein